MKKFRLEIKRFLIRQLSLTIYTVNGLISDTVNGLPSLCTCMQSVYMSFDLKFRHYSLIFYFSFGLCLLLWFAEMVFIMQFARQRHNNQTVDTHYQAIEV